MPEWNVPGYTELKALGSGGFGEVMLARHDASGVLVAIKYLRRDLAADTEFAQMFRGEAQVLAALDDPHIVRLYEYVESPAGAAIVMELIGGVCLREILTHQGKTTAEAALVVLQGSLLGLRAAHQRGVVHRDYKPENVLVDGDGASKLTDFGIAARAGTHPVPAGTLLYAAPEQMAGASASPASDLYAATATFYECLTGRPPFSGEAAALIWQHRMASVPLDPVPGPLRPLVAAGMAKDPGGRPADLGRFVAELQTAASGAYGPHWQERGRSHLGEAALLLAALWPAGPPPSVQGTAVHRVSLFRHMSVAKAAVEVGVTISVAAAGTALAAAGGGSPRPVATNRPVAAVQPVSLGPSSPVTASSPASITPASITPTSITPTSITPSSTSPSPGPPSPSISPTFVTLAPSPSPSAPSAPSPSPTSTSPSAPQASVCQPDGTGCTKGGTYPDPDALINSDYGGFKLTWTSTSVQPYSSGVPLYWTVGVAYQNTGSTTLGLGCQGDVTDLSSVQEHMSGGDGDDGSVSAYSTTCSQDPTWSARVAPGDSVEVYVTFHNVPWPGSAVAIQWGDVGASAAIYPFT